MPVSRIPVTLPAHWYNRTKNMIMAAVFVAVIASVADIGHAQTFHKTKMLNDKGKEVSVDLCFDEQSKLLTVKPHKTTVADVPYGAIEKLSYEQAAHHRVRDGAGTMGVGCIGGTDVHQRKESLVLRGLQAGRGHQGTHP